VDIATSLGVTKASVSHATKLLRENSYIRMDDDKCITLTSPGREIAERMYQRHRVLAQFLMRLGVAEATAFADAAAWNTISPPKRSPPSAAMRKRTGINLLFTAL
jgi:Mn-dependent DtxR family transcriptional regulator